MYTDTLARGPRRQLAEVEGGRAECCRGPLTHAPAASHPRTACHPVRAVSQSTRILTRRRHPPPSPGDLDDAVLDRMDEALEFGLPGVQQREKLLRLYLDRWAHFLYVPALKPSRCGYIGSRVAKEGWLNKTTPAHLV